MANKCQSLPGLVRWYRHESAIDHLTELIRSTPIPMSDAARATVQAICVKTLIMVLVEARNSGVVVSADAALDRVIRCLTSYLRFEKDSEIVNRTFPVWPPPLVAAIRCMERLVDDPRLDLKYAAGRVGLSPWQLDRLLRKHADTSFVPLLRRIRIARAATLLDTTMLRIKEIAAATGYTHVTTFDRDFKSVHRITPSEWRRRATSAARPPHAPEGPRRDGRASAPRPQTTRASVVAPFRRAPHPAE